MNTLSIIKDIIISAVIAVLTSGFFEVSNIIYQSIITVLILIIIFLILRGIDKKAKRMEILSILYAEQFLIPFMKAVNDTENIRGATKFNKVKVFIILPESITELGDIKQLIMKLDRFNISNPNNKTRDFYASGQVIGQDQLSIFDTPMTWVAGLEHLNKVKAMSDRKLSQLLTKMANDIKAYVKKLDKDTDIFKNLSFISFLDYKSHYQ
ncbi:hypothetical protein [Seonamhaeicola sp.]|uniref:hypothetical protein n=1 Tax=Seonamhaeicola sp. TaxID=1912245 RepID=UPI002616FCBB|nr:hypothetical protein [Seonamhaeicola sp.]